VPGVMRVPGPLRMSVAWVGLALGGSGCVPVASPLPSPAAERAALTTLGAAGSTVSKPLVKPPPRPCKEHHARPEPDAPCQPIPCGGRCAPDQRCDEAALVPTCVPR
jgi:hypothetical protein